jgi:hypothetical protein
MSEQAPERMGIDFQYQEYFEISAYPDWTGHTEYIRADLVEAAVRRALEAAALKCNERGASEQEQEGLTRNVQNHYRCRDAIRAMSTDDDLVRKLAEGE